MISDSQRRRLPRWASTLVVLGVSILCLTPFPGRGAIETLGSTVLEPIQFGVSGTFGEVANVVDTLQRVRTLATENRDLRDRNDELESDVVRLHELEVENRELRNLLSLRDQAGPGGFIPTTVIARDDTPYVQAITIDRGGNDGVKEDAVVITHKGLVGRGERVNPTWAKSSQRDWSWARWRGWSARTPIRSRPPWSNQPSRWTSSNGCTCWPIPPRRNGKRS